MFCRRSYVMQLVTAAAWHNHLADEHRTVTAEQATIPESCKALQQHAAGVQHGARGNNGWTSCVASAHDSLHALKWWSWTSEHQCGCTGWAGAPSVRADSDCTDPSTALGRSSRTHRCLCISSSGRWQVNECPLLCTHQPHPLRVIHRLKRVAGMMSRRCCAYSTLLSIIVTKSTFVVMIISWCLGSPPPHRGVGHSWDTGGWTAICVS